MYYSNSPYENTSYGTRNVNRIPKFPENPMYGQSYVPIQYLDKVYTESIALKKGTLFPELLSNYVPGQSMREISYIRSTNKKEGLCQC